MARLLKEGWPCAWIKKHQEDLVAQAGADIAHLLETDRAYEPVGLLLRAAYWRAVKVLDLEQSRPASISTDALLGLPDETSRSPEQESLDHELRERVAQALVSLPKREQQLIWLVTYEEVSIRKAGRQLGWGKSSADRHYQAACERLRLLLRDFGI